MATRRISALLAMVGIVLVVGACSPGPDPEPIAEAFAADLQDGEFDQVPIAAPDAAAEQLSAILGDLETVEHSVQVSGLTEPGDEPDVRYLALTWTFRITDDAELSFDGQARLDLIDEQWTPAWSPAAVHADATSGSTFVIERTTGERGVITGFDGEPLVQERSVLHIGIDKQNFPDEADFVPAAQALAQALALADAEEFVQRVRDAGPKAYVVALTIRASEQETYGVDELRLMPAVLLVEDVMPLPPTPMFARPLLGAAGEATAELIEDSGGSIRPGDVVGLTGLQRSYDDLLRGMPGMRITLTATPGGDAVVYDEAAVDGEPLATTFETTLQAYAEDRLASQETPSALVAIQASTGEVLVAASGPGGGGVNTATVAQYPPGSTFKLVTALALIRAGMTPDSQVSCTETVNVDGREFANYPGYPPESLGSITLREAIAQSCNTALIAQHAELDSEELADAAASLGLGAKPEAGKVWSFPYYSGNVPDNAVGTTHAIDLIGQGEVLVSPMAMAGVAASIAAGQTTIPVLVTDPQPAAIEAPPTPLTQDEAQMLRELMFSVVTEGTGDFLQDVPGDPVGAKSGTAQFGQQIPPQTHAWMIGFAGDLAVAVFVAEGDFGTATAGPILYDFLVVANEVDWSGS
ncbi:MAG: penicillin-binding transpeptidase domain-containing protein [Beutenbergiaceae bacterium]